MSGDGMATHRDWALPLLVEGVEEREVVSEDDHLPSLGLLDQPSGHRVPVLVVQRGNRVVKDDGTRVAGCPSSARNAAVARQRCSPSPAPLDFGALRRILESQVVEDFADVAFLQTPP